MPKQYRLRRRRRRRRMNRMFKVRSLLKSFAGLCAPDFMFCSFWTPTLFGCYAAVGCPRRYACKPWCSKCSMTVRVRLGGAVTLHRSTGKMRCSLQDRSQFGGLNCTSSFKNLRVQTRCPAIEDRALASQKKNKKECY